MGAITEHVLDQEIGAIGLEGDAIYIRSVSGQQNPSTLQPTISVVHM